MFDCVYNIAIAIAVYCINRILISSANLATLQSYEFTRFNIKNKQYLKSDTQTKMEVGMGMLEQ